MHNGATAGRERQSETETPGLFGRARDKNQEGKRKKLRIDRARAQADTRNALVPKGKGGDKNGAKKQKRWENGRNLE